MQVRRIGECVTWKADSALGREALGGTRYDLVMSLRCAVLGRGLGRHVLRHRYSLYGHHLAVPCDKVRLLSSSHRPDFWGVWGGQGRAWGGWGSRWCACAYWPMLARREAAAWASEGTATFRVWPWPLHPSTPMYAAEGTEGEGEGQASWVQAWGVELRHRWTSSWPGRACKAQAGRG